MSGLLTIGPRFGGAIDDAARYFQDACDRGLDPDEFVEEMKKKGIRVPGIGHRIKSKVPHCTCCAAGSVSLARSGAEAILPRHIARLGAQVDLVSGSRSI